MMMCRIGKSRRFNALSPKGGFPGLITKKRLMDPRNGYIVDDNCVFGGEVFVMKPKTRVVECLWPGFVIPRNVTSLRTTTAAF